MGNSAGEFPPFISIFFQFICFFCVDTALGCVTFVMAVFVCMRGVVFLFILPFASTVMVLVSLREPSCCRYRERRLPFPSDTSDIVSHGRQTSCYLYRSLYVPKLSSSYRRSTMPYGLFLIVYLKLTLQYVLVKVGLRLVILMKIYGGYMSLVVRCMFLNKNYRMATRFPQV